MNEVSPAVSERARKIESAVLQGLASQGQVTAAKALGVSESAISRLKDGQIHVVAQLLAYLGLKVVPEQVKCVDPEVAHAMFKIYSAAIDRMADPTELLYTETA